MASRKAATRAVLALALASLACAARPKGDLDLRLAIPGGTGPNPPAGAGAVEVSGDLPGRVPWSPGLTLTQALSAVAKNGVGPEIDLVSVTRGGRTAYPDVMAIATGRAYDVYLEPGDAVLVRCKSAARCMALRRQ